MFSISGVDLDPPIIGLEVNHVIAFYFIQSQSCFNEIDSSTKLIFGNHKFSINFLLREILLISAVMAAATEDRTSYVLVSSS